MPFGSSLAAHRWLAPSLLDPVHYFPALQVVADDESMSVNLPFRVQVPRSTRRFAMGWAYTALFGIVLGSPYTGSKVSPIFVRRTEPVPGAHQNQTPGPCIGDRGLNLLQEPPTGRGLGMRCLVQHTQLGIRRRRRDLRPEHHDVP